MDDETKNMRASNASVLRELATKVENGELRAFFIVTVGTDGGEFEAAHAEHGTSNSEIRGLVQTVSLLANRLTGV